MNYIVAGMVFEAATGARLFDEIERRILKPFHLDETVPIEGHTLDNLAHGQIAFRRAGIKGETIQDGRERFAFQAEYAGGGLISTPADLVRWAGLL